MIGVAETIAKIAVAAKEEDTGRKGQLCFLLSSRIAPFYKEYVVRNHGDDEGLIENVILEAWDSWTGNNKLNTELNSEIDKRIPEEGIDEWYVYAQNAMMCTMYMLRYIGDMNFEDLKYCIIVYSDQLDYMVQIGREEIRETPMETDRRTMSSPMLKKN